MNYFSTFNNHADDIESFGFSFAKLENQKRPNTWVASSLEDFMNTTRLMKRAARHSCSPIEPLRIGRLLSSLNHGGSGPKTGCVLLIDNGSGPVGFALMLIKPNVGLELSWLHSECSCQDDGIVESLWDHAICIQKDWGFKILHVGVCAKLPDFSNRRIG